MSIQGVFKLNDEDTLVQLPLGDYKCGCGKQAWFVIDGRFLRCKPHAKIGTQLPAESLLPSPSSSS